MLSFWYRWRHLGHFREISGSQGIFSTSPQVYYSWPYHWKVRTVVFYSKRAGSVIATPEEKWKISRSISDSLQLHLGCKNDFLHFQGLFVLSSDIWAFYFCLEPKDPAICGTPSICSHRCALVCDRPLHKQLSWRASGPQLRWGGVSLGVSACCCLKSLIEKMCVALSPQLWVVFKFVEHHL